MLIKILSLSLLCGLFASLANAQGQDSTPAERDIMILGEMLPGLYDNANQSYFDVRLKQPETQRHKNVYNEISRIELKAYGQYVFSVESGVRRDESARQHQLYALEVDNTVQAVRMKVYQLKKAPNKKLNLRAASYLEGCDVLWRQEAGQFRGQRDDGSCAQSAVAADMMLSEDALWLNNIGKQRDGNQPDDKVALSHHALDRARLFDCYADLPGVGGGRDIPYQRYHLNGIHDLGGEKWFTDKDGNEFGINLFRVMWTFNNYEGVFTRPSFVVYVKTKEQDKKTQNKKTKELGYAWTEPTAQRIGINLKWMLVNCYMLSNEDVTPFYKSREPKLK